MKIFSKPILFEWDNGNIDKNYYKHGVSNVESEEVFHNKPLIANFDFVHSMEEMRFQALGKTNKDRLLFLSFTVRKDKIRIISARDMSRKEKSRYEKE